MLKRIAQLLNNPAQGIARDTSVRAGGTVFVKVGNKTINAIAVNDINGAEVAVFWAEAENRYYAISPHNPVLIFSETREIDRSRLAEEEVVELVYFVFHDGNSRWSSVLIDVGFNVDTSYYTRSLLISQEISEYILGDRGIPPSNDLRFFHQRPNKTQESLTIPDSALLRFVDHDPRVSLGRINYLNFRGIELTSDFVRDVIDNELNLIFFDWNLTAGTSVQTINLGGVDFTFDRISSFEPVFSARGQGVSSFNPTLSDYPYTLTGWAASSLTSPSANLYVVDSISFNNWSSTWESSISDSGSNPNASYSLEAFHTSSVTRPLLTVSNIVDQDEYRTEGSHSGSGYQTTQENMSFNQLGYTVNFDPVSYTVLSGTVSISNFARLDKTISMSKLVDLVPATTVSRVDFSFSLTMQIQKIASASFSWSGTYLFNTLSFPVGISGSKSVNHTHNSTYSESDTGGRPTSFPSVGYVTGKFTYPNTIVQFRNGDPPTQTVGDLVHVFETSARAPGGGLFGNVQTTTFPYKKALDTITYSSSASFSGKVACNIAVNDTEVLVGVFTAIVSSFTRNITLKCHLEVADTTCVADSDTPPTTSFHVLLDQPPGAIFLYNHTEDTILIYELFDRNFNANYHNLRIDNLVFGDFSKIADCFLMGIYDLDPSTSSTYFSDYFKETKDEYRNVSLENKITYYNSITEETIEIDTIGSIVGIGDSATISATTITPTTISIQFMEIFDVLGQVNESSNYPSSFDFIETDTRPGGGNSAIDRVRTSAINATTARTGLTALVGEDFYYFDRPNSILYTATLTSVTRRIDIPFEWNLELTITDSQLLQAGVFWDDGNGGFKPATLVTKDNLIAMFVNARRINSEWFFRRLTIRDKNLYLAYRSEDLVANSGEGYVHRFRIENNKIIFLEEIKANILDGAPSKTASIDYRQYTE